MEKKINEDTKTEPTQPNLPFKKVETNINIKKFKLPLIEYLKKPSKNDSKFDNSNSEHANSDLLEKIFMDFDVEEKIKKISNGHVVIFNDL